MLIPPTILSFWLDISIELSSLDVAAVLKDGLGTFWFDTTFVGAMLVERAATDFLAFRREDGVRAGLPERVVARGDEETCEKKVEKIEMLVLGRNQYKHVRIYMNRYRLAK